MEAILKVSQKIAVFKRMKKLLPLVLREKLYRAFIAPHFNYCVESKHFWSNRSTDNLRGDAILKLPKVNSIKYEIKSWR